MAMTSSPFYRPPLRLHALTGWYRHPPGSVAYEFTGALPEPARAAQPLSDSRTLKARKPAGHGSH